MLDPACGTGGFLVNALDARARARGAHAGAGDGAAGQIRGVEKKPLPHLLCTTNMLLHGIDVPTQVRRDNTLARPLRDYTAKDRVDVILTNPPFGGEEEQGIETNFPAQFQTRETADLFLVLIMQLLKDGGRAAVVLPDGFLFGEGIKTRIKERLLAECDLHTIVRLPKGVFAPVHGHQDQPAVLHQGAADASEVWYYEHPYPAGQKSYSKTQPIRIEEFEAEQAWWTAREETPQAWRVPVEEVRRRGYNLDMKNPHAADAGHGDPDVLLAEYRQAVADVEATREALKAQLAGALESALAAGAGA